MTTTLQLPPLKGADTIVRVRDRVVLVREADFPLWHLPGGHIEPGENDHDAALRELHEELPNLRIDALESVTIYTAKGKYPGEGLVRIHLFRAMLDAYPLPDISPGDEILESYLVPISHIFSGGLPVLDATYQALKIMEDV